MIVIQCLFYASPWTSRVTVKVILEALNVGQASWFVFVEGALYQHRLPSPEVTVRSCLFQADLERPTLGPRMLFIVSHTQHAALKLKQHPYCFLSEPTTRVSQSHFPAWLPAAINVSQLNWPLDKGNHLWETRRVECLPEHMNTWVSVLHKEPSREVTNRWLMIIISRRMLFRPGNWIFKIIINSNWGRITPIWKISGKKAGDMAQLAKCLPFMPKTLNALSNTS